MEFYNLPQPDEIDERQRQDASGAYLMMFATTALGLPLPVINMIASIVYYFVNKSKGNFVKFHALQSLYSQFPVSILNSYLVIWAIVNFVKHNPFTDVFWGLVITAGIFNIVYFIFSIIAAVKAHKGLFYYFLFFGRISYLQTFKKRNIDSQKLINKPPKM